MSINDVKGIFTISGSIDRPLSYNDRNKFGFVEGTPEPIFKYSYSEIKDFYDDPVEMYKVSKLEPNKILSLLCENGETYDLCEENIDDVHWVETFEILEYVYNNQQSASSAAINGVTLVSDPEYRLNQLDEWATDNIVNYVSQSAYVTDSTSIVGRVSHVRFRMDIGGIVTDMEFFLNPDDLMYTYGLLKHSIYDYQDNFITESEWKTEVVEKILALESNHNYTNVMRFGTTKVIHDTAGVEVDRFIKYFYIFTHMFKLYDAPLSFQTLMVKNYLIDLHNRDYQFLTQTYPDLFTEVTVHLYPLIDNKFMGNIIQPVSRKVVDSEFIRRGIPEASKLDADIFSLEGFGTGDVDTPGVTANSIFKIPLLAVEENSLLPTSPISNRFGRFGIRHSGITNTGESWETLHLFIKIAMKVVMGIIPFEELSGNPVVGMGNFKATAALDHFGNSYTDTVSFEFVNVKYVANTYLRYGG